MRHTIPKRERLFRRMQQLSQKRMVTGQKLSPICQGDMNHRAPHCQHDFSSLRLGPLTLSWPVCLNQVHLLFALSLFCRQVQQLVQCVKIGPRRGHNDVRIRPMT